MFSGVNNILNTETTERMSFNLSRDNPDSQGTVQADVRIKFLEKTTWNDALILQDSLERNGFLGSSVSITDCSADDACK